MGAWNRPLEWLLRGHRGLSPACVDCMPATNSAFMERESIGNDRETPADNNRNPLQPRARACKHAACHFGVWSPGVLVESRRQKAAPVASTGVQTAFV